MLLQVALKFEHKDSMTCLPDGPPFEWQAYQDLQHTYGIPKTFFKVFDEESGFYVLVSLQVPFLSVITMLISLLVSAGQGRWRNLIHFSDCLSNACMDKVACQSLK